MTVVIVDSFDSYAKEYGFKLTNKRLKLQCKNPGYYPASDRLNKQLTGRSSGFFNMHKIYEAAIINSNNVERVIIKGHDIIYGSWFHNMYNIDEIQNKNNRIFNIIDYSPFSEFPKLHKRLPRGIIVGKKYGI